MTFTVGVQVLLILIALVVWIWLSRKSAGFGWEMLFAFIFFALFFATSWGTELLDFLSRLFATAGQAEITEGG